MAKFHSDDARTDRLLRMASRYACLRFAGDADHPDKVADAVSSAWEFHRRAPHAPLKSVVFYAVQRVKAGRQFTQSARCVAGPNPRRQRKPHRVQMDVHEFFRLGDNPADIGGLRIDYAAWLAGLKPTKRRVAKYLAGGATTTEAAERFHVTLGRISQLRRELLESWQAFVGDC